MAQLLTEKWQDKFLKAGCFILLLTFNCSFSQLNISEDCPTATRICDVTQSYYFETEGPGSIDDAYGAMNVFCINDAGWTQWENLASWFIFTPQYSGEFGFLVCPEIQTDEWNWALFVNPSCTDLNNVSSWLSCNVQPPAAVVQGCTGIGFKNGYGGGGTSGMLAYINIIAGNTYVLYAEADILPITTPQRATLSFQGAVVTAHPDLFSIPNCNLSADDFIKDTTKVFPNPFTNSVQVQSEISFISMALYDVAGKQIFTQNFTNTIDTTNLAKGLYLLYLTTDDNEVVVKKVVKE
jgi:hypothetical protein